MLPASKYSDFLNKTISLLGEAMLAVLVTDSTHDEVDPDRREAKGASEGRAGAEVVLRGAVEVFEGKMRLQDGKIRTGWEAKRKGGTGGVECETQRFDGNRWLPRGGGRATYVLEGVLLA